MNTFKLLATGLVIILVSTKSFSIQTEANSFASICDLSDYPKDKDSSQNQCASGYFSDPQLSQQIRESKLKTKRKFTHSFTISAGQSNQTIHWNSLLIGYQDTSDNIFRFNSQSPTISFTHDIALDNSFSIGYSIGYQKTDITLNGEQFSTRNIFAFVNPRLIVYRNSWFEGYFQLKIGVVHHDAELDQIESRYVAGWMPTNYKVYTGVTPIAASLKLGDRCALNAEVSFFSFESVNVGFRYMFKSNRHYIPKAKNK